MSRTMPWFLVLFLISCIWLSAWKRNISLHTHVNLLSLWGCPLRLDLNWRLILYLLPLSHNILHHLGVCWSIRLHHVLNLLLSYCQELLCLKSSLNLNHGVCIRWHLRSCTLDLFYISVGVSSVQEHPYGCETHQNILNVLVILMLLN